MNYDDQFMKQNQKPPLASPGSLKYLHDLLASRDHEVAVSKLPEVWQDLLNSIAVGNDNVAQKDVSKFIDMLKTCDRKSMSTKAPIPGSAIAANPPTEDGIYAKRTDHRGQPLKDTHFKFYKVYWNRDNNRLLAKEIVLIQDAVTYVDIDSSIQTTPAVSELQYRGQAYRFVTADDKYNPTLEEAIAFGPKYGRCSQCGRNLNDELSVQLGIGPVCGQRDFGNDFKIMKKMAQMKLKGYTPNEDEIADMHYKAGIVGLTDKEMRARLAEIDKELA